MSSLLRRSKSTRDARAKVTRDQLDFNFVTEIGPAAAAAVAAAAKVEAPEPTASKLLKLARRKSVSSIHTTLKIAHISSNLPKTADPRNRQSVLYREEEASPVPPVPVEYSTRSSSGMSSYGVVPDLGIEDGECCVIGMAIGSPTEIIGQQQQSPGSENLGPPVFPTHNMYSNDAGTSSTSKLSNKRFEVQVRGPVVSGARRGAFLHKEKENEKEIKRGREGGCKGNYQQEEPPKTGWRKMFGKGFFGGRRNYPKQQQPEPATKKLELVTRDKLSPHVVPKVVPKSKQPWKKSEPSPAPCLNVDIPEVEMERYSVMFGTLLHPSEKSTIFARRKSRDAVASKKKTAADTEKQGPSQLYLTPLKRNATTGQVCRSPASMLDVSPLPSTISGTSRTPSPSGLTRAKTTTEGSPSLSPRTVYMVRAHSRKEALNDPSADTPGPLLRRRSSSKISKITEESSIDTPRGSFDEGDDEWLTKEDDGEPQWEMVTPCGKSPNEPMSEAQIETAAQISIARQISISQRQLLIPIIPKSQRLVSRTPIRKAMVHPKFPMPTPSQPKTEQQSQQQTEHPEQPEQQEQPQSGEQPVQAQAQAQKQSSEPGPARS